MVVTGERRKNEGRILNTEQSQIICLQLQGACSSWLPDVDLQVQVLVSSAGSIKQLLKLWTAYYTSQRGVLDMAAKLDFHHATMKLHKLEAITIEFESSTTKLKKAFSAFDCVTTGPEDSGKSGLLTNFQKLGFLILAAGVALCLLVRGSKPTKTKPKIN